MEYLLIFILEIIGISCHVMEMITAYDKQFPTYNKKQIFGVFWEQDWTTLCWSAIVLVINLIAQYIIDTNAPSVHAFMKWGIPYIVWAYVAALVLGYAGQAILNKWLGTAKQVLIKKSETIEAKLQ